MPAFDDILTDIKRGVVTLAETTVRKYRDEAVADAAAFLDATKGKLARWTTLLAQGDLTTEDFEWLVHSQADLAKMHALKQKGLALARVDAFRHSLLNLVTDTVFGAVVS